MSRWHSGNGTSWRSHNQSDPHRKVRWCCVWVKGIWQWSVLKCWMSYFEGFRFYGWQQRDKLFPMEARTIGCVSETELQALLSTALWWIQKDHETSIASQADQTWTWILKDLAIFGNASSAISGSGISSISADICRLNMCHRNLGYIIGHSEFHTQFHSAFQNKLGALTIWPVSSFNCIANIGIWGWVKTLYPWWTSK